MSATYTTKLLLAFRSGDRCALPGCGKALTRDGQQADPVVTGQAAHIAGEKEGAARYDPSMTDEQRNHYNNLIYLCGDCHGLVDKQEVEYSVRRLLELKSEHEAKVSVAVADAFPDVGFRELEVATQWILQVQPSQSSQDFLLTPPKEKIKKNNLTETAQRIITMGLSVARDVKSFVEKVSQIESDFPDRLKAGFLEEYYRLKREGHAGDVLFDLMCGFAQRGLVGTARVAGLAVLIYLFEACEVFEK